MIEKLASVDSSDWMDNTRYFCRAAIPTRENKEAMWKDYFDNDIDWQYSNYSMSFSGFNQIQQRHLLTQFTDLFFQRIPEVFEKKGRFIAELYFHYLQPNIYATDEMIGKY